VKEQIITRFAELGATVAGGNARFEPALLPTSELLPRASEWRYLDAAGRTRVVDVPAGGLGFTWCGTPIVYRRTDDDEGSILVVATSGEAQRTPGTSLDAGTTRSLVSHDDGLERIEVEIPARVLR
jgi:hypothetical protein